MNITNEESLLERYAIISYSHEDTEVVKSELKMFDNNYICYWLDERMTAGTVGFDTQFFEMLDKPNCKGIIFFISDDFLLSEPCANEMKHFKEKYNTGNPDKFCLFVLPKGYPCKDASAILARIKEYVKNDPAKIEKLFDVKEHVNLFLELNQNGTVLYGELNNANNYIDTCCKEGQTFYNAGVIFGHEQISYSPFGFYPQKQAINIKNTSDTVKRDTDKEPASYTQLEWLVIKDADNTQTLLSKKLLFVIDYLSLRHPFRKTDKTIAEQIKDKFDKYFRPGDDKRKIKDVRFLSERELQALLRGSKGDIGKRREILLPEPTYFAQISNRKDVHAFWLAGDMNDARRVDTATGSLSDQKTGVELYYVRIVIEVEK